MTKRSSSAARRRGPKPNVRPPLVQAPPPRLRFQRKDTEQYHVCLAAPGISRSDRRRFAASLLDAILGGSASSRLFQEIREKRGMAYAVYSFVSQYTDTGQIGVYLGTREDNLADALAITAEQIADIAGGNLPASELERAKENLKGRILLSMESTSTRMNRLGKSLITDSELLSLDRIVAEIDAVEASVGLRAGRGAARVRAAVGRVHRPERGAVPRSARAHHARRSRARRERPPQRPRAARSARCSVRGSRRPATRSSTRSPTPRRWSTSRARTRSLANVRAAVDGGRAVRRRHDGLGHRGVVATRRVAVFYAPNFAIGAVLMMRFAAEASSYIGSAEIVELHHADQARRAVRHREGDRGAHGTATCRSTRCGCRGSYAHQEVILGGAGETLTIRHDTTSREAYTPGVLLALEKLAVAAARA